MSARPAPLDWLALGVLVLVWGTAFAVVKVSLESMGPLWLSAFRLGLGSVVILLVLARRIERLPRPPEYGWLVLLGFLNSALPQVLVGWATLTVPSAVVGLLMATSPIMLMLFSLVLLPEERASAMRVLGVLVGFAGVALVLLGRGAGPSGLEDGGLLPYLALLVGAASFALTAILGRRLMSVPVWTRSTGVVMGAFLCALVMALIFEAPPTAISPASLWSVLYLGAAPTAIGGLLLYWLLDRTSAAFTVQTNYLLPVVAMITGILAWGETVSLMQWAGMLVILLGMGLAEQIWRRR